MKKLAIGRLTLLMLLTVNLSGCALFPHHHWWWTKAKPAPVPAVAPQALADDGVYDDAVVAVSHRDYASALDLLQTARARNPSDARVMNAFGVVYDKLGRFDLSERYYAQAEALDPGSQIVANNRAYSLLMQGRGAPAGPAFAQAKPVVEPQAAAVIAIAFARPAAIVVDLGHAAPTTTRHPLVVADGSWREGATRSISAERPLTTAGADLDGAKVWER